MSDRSCVHGYLHCGPCSAECERIAGLVMDAYGQEQEPRPVQIRWGIPPGDVKSIASIVDQIIDTNGALSRTRRV